MEALNRIRILAGLLALALAGPALAQEPPEGSASGGAEIASASENGSLWSEAPNNEFMFYDRKARRVGDLVTVKIIETSQATRNAKTELDRETSHSAGVSALLGLETSLAEAKPNVKPSALLGATTANSFAGDGSTTRSGTLTATITARVVRVMPNGNLVIDGRQEVKVNDEIQLLTVRGIVRMEDIQVNNEVLSTYIADAKIEYTGNGAVATKMKTPWLSDTINKVWPF